MQIKYPYRLGSASLSNIQHQPEREVTTINISQWQVLLKELDEGCLTDSG